MWSNGVCAERFAHQPRRVIDRDVIVADTSAQNRPDRVDAQRRRAATQCWARESVGARSGVVVEDQHSGAESLSGHRHDEGDSAV